MTVVALVGISGVGKSTFLRALAERAAFHHVTASDVIKAELARGEQGALSSEELRLGAVPDNQEALVNGFLRYGDDKKLPVILDGHVLIDGRDGLVPIPADIFRRIHTRHLVFLQDDPASIWNRRAADSERLRPNRSPEELGEQQNLAIQVAARICCKLSIDMLVLKPSLLEPLQRLISW